MCKKMDLKQSFVYKKYRFYLLVNFVNKNIYLNFSYTCEFTYHLNGNGYILLFSVLLHKLTCVCCVFL